MELNPKYLNQHGNIIIGDSKVEISETAKTFIHEFAHCIWYNSLTEEDRRAWEGLSRFLTREQLTGNMNQYIVGEKKRFDGSSVYSTFYTYRDDSFVSIYARFNIREDWSECYLYYKVDPKTLQRVDKNKYAFLEEKIGQRIEKTVKKQDEEEEEEYSPDIEEPHLVRDKIIATLYGLKDDLSYKAKEHISSAYNLGRQKGVYYTGAAFLTAMQQADKDRVQEILDRNDKFLDGFMDDMVDEFDDVLFTKTPAGMIEAEKTYDDIDEFDSEFTDVMETKEHRLGLYAVNGLSLGLMAGMMMETGDQFAGGVWHTSEDDRVCDGCDKLDGMWMSFDEYDTLYGNNECDGNCRCGELFEPTLAPGDSMAMMAKFEEEQHPRDKDGKFTASGGGKGEKSDDAGAVKVFNFDSTGVSHYNNLFGPRGEEKDNVDGITQKEYYEKHKQQVGQVVNISPDEYLSIIPHAEPSPESQKHLKDKLAAGEKLNIGFLDYSQTKFAQEGRNRAYLARELGIKKIPVLIVAKGKLQLEQLTSKYNKDAKNTK
jgi:hypothetical protein